MKKFEFLSKTMNCKKSQLSSDQCRYSKDMNKSENDKVLSTLRTRNNSSGLKLNQEIASKVVRDYILPMFHKDSKEKSLEKRRISHGLKSSRHNYSSSFDGTLYTELKLSDHLSSTIQTLQQQLTQSNFSINHLEQSNYIIQADLKNSESLLLTHQSTISSLLQENLLQQKLIQMSTSSNVFINKQLEESEIIIKKLNEEKEVLSKYLCEEKALNDIRLLIYFFFNSWHISIRTWLFRLRILICLYSMRIRFYVIGLRKWPVLLKI